METRSLYIIRHCECLSQDWNATLSPRGALQAKRLAEYMTSLGIKRIVSSSMSRAQETANIVAKRLSIPMGIDYDLKERLLGDTGTEHWRSALCRSFKNKELRFAGGESNSQAEKRVKAALDRVRTGSSVTTAIVSHGNLITLLANLKDGHEAFKFWEQLATPDLFSYQDVENGRLTRIKLEEETV